jgi:Tol biopolymer transport system component/DNA-binding winged helix-turn-helix (wHTH) protein
MKTGATYEFGPYRQDAAARTLTRQGAPVAITPKAFDTLLHLVSNAGRTISREELIQAVWPDTFVEDGNLNYNISQIRKTLGEYAPDVPYIQTLPKQGYRFIARVSHTGDGLHETSSSLHSPQAKQLRGVRAVAVFILLAATAITAWVRLRSEDAARHTTPGLLRLTSESGLTMTPALSPDGTLVAYASDRSGEGNLDIWVQHVGGREALRLTQDRADDYAPSFSPDGRTIAFRSEREGGGIYVVSALGGESRKIAPYGRRPRFSPDGKWITYWIGAEPGDASSFFLPPGTAKIYIVPSAGGSSQHLQPEFAAAGYPIWTPDSKRVLFLGNRDPNLYHDGAMDWWVTSIDGGPALSTGANVAFQDMGLATVSQAPETWTPDGAAVLMSATLADTRNIWRVPISSRDWKVSGAPRRVTLGTALDLQPSTGGDRVIFASLNGNLDVWSLSVDANRGEPSDGLERLTRHAFPHAYPAVSPDGTKLAFSSRRSGSRDIWVRDLRTAKETAVSMPPGPSFNPNFSPDGNILLYRTNKERTSAAYAVSLAAGSTERVCEDCMDYGWSSDKKKLVLVGTAVARHLCPGPCFEAEDGIAEPSGVPSVEYPLLA